MSPLRYGGQQASRRAVIILIACLAVVASVYGAAKMNSHHHVHSLNPAAPLVGAIDRAKATANAANDRTNQLNGQIGSTSPGEVNPLGP
jgi:disulfide bond formation protein DsbB